MRARPWLGASVDLLAVLVIGAAALLALYQWPSITPLRAALGLPFLLFGVGYAATCAIYGPDRLDGSATIRLALTLSIAITVLTALTLYAANVKFTGRALLIAELATSAVMCAVARVRRQGDRGAIGRRFNWRNVVTSRLAWASLAPVAVFAGLIVLLSRPLPDSHVAGYSALWAVRAGSGSVEIGVSNSQLQAIRYRVEVIPSAGRRTTRSLTLSPGEQWRHSIHVAGPISQPMIVKLYRSNDSRRAYREIAVGA